MLRITVVESSASAVTLRVEGRIAGPWVEELRTTCDVQPGRIRFSCTWIWRTFLSLMRRVLPSSRNCGRRVSGFSASLPF